MNALVTGATGFLGRYLCPALERRGWRVDGVHTGNADLTREDALTKFARGRRYDRVFHLAAWTQAGDFCLRHPGEQWIINQKINTNVLSWWLEAQPEAKLVSIGTSCSYAPDRELVEDDYLEGTPIESLFTYAMTKRMLHVGQMALARQYGLKFLTVVPSTLYGPGYHEDGRQMHFIFDLVRKIVRGKRFGEPVVLWGDGHQRREVVYVTDFVSAMLDLADRVENDLVNIGAGEDHSIREFAALICAEVGYDPADIAYDETRYVGARSKRLSVEKLRRLLPGLTLTPLSEGIARTVRWYEERETSRKA